MRSPLHKGIFMKLAILVLIGILTQSFAHASQTDLFKKAEALFQTGTQPNPELLSSGWFSGRCYLRRDPNTEKSGVLVLMVNHGLDGGPATIKQIIPALSIFDETDFFDEISDEEHEIYSEELYASSNPLAFFQDGSLMSHLHYGILIGTLHTRAVGTDLIVTLTNYEETPNLESNAFFYCLISKKSREL